MECCRCDKEIDLDKEDAYNYDYMEEVWCKECMEEEVSFALSVSTGEIVL